METIIINHISLLDLREAIREELGNYSLNCSKIINRQVDSTEQLLTIKEAAKLLQVNVQTIYGYISKSEIPHYRRGKLYFLKHELINWVKQTRRKTNAQIEADAYEYLREF